jgi:hypothetical protein
MSDKSPLQSFIAAHPRFHLAILLGEVGVSGAVQAATQGDTISLAVLQAIDLYLKECEQKPEEPIICVACDRKIEDNHPVGFVVTYGDVDEEHADCACIGVCRKCAALPLVVFTEIVTRRMEAEIGAEMEPQVPPESIH